MSALFTTKRIAMNAETLLERACSELERVKEIAENLGETLIEIDENLLLDIYEWNLQQRASEVIPAKCQGTNCSAPEEDHSPECIIEAAASQGWLLSPDAKNAMLTFIQRDYRVIKQHDQPKELP